MSILHTLKRKLCSCRRQQDGVLLPTAITASQTLPLFRVLQQFGIAASGGEGRRVVRGGGVKVDGKVEMDENRLMSGGETITWRRREFFVPANVLDLLNTLAPEWNTNSISQKDYQDVLTVLRSVSK
ncbi:RNA-binding S4 domain-containing protein [Gluconobacter oxydans]|uniref:RNA-binding S4 domain-containing protein n=1 Tax=Gluconobacter oxydans TaxID=442 RepID=UPI001CD8D7C6|nr:RNA-binding S4 domain-containing protein [Gluconobacter oxydans]